MERVQLVLLQRKGDLDGTEMALGVGVHQTTTSGWLTGKYTPKLVAALLLPEVLGVNPLWLFYGIGEMHDAVEGSMETHGAYYRGRIRQVVELQQYAEREMEALAGRDAGSTRSTGGGAG